MFDQLREIMLKCVHVLVITETRLDDAFLTSQFLVTVFPMSYRLDQNRNGAEDYDLYSQWYSCRLLRKHVLPDDIEGLFVEVNFRKLKSLLFGTHHLPSESDSNCFNNLDKALDL